jgi:transcription termination/antitermination protein NusA
VRIESSAREPGARSKIAGSSRDRDVDPVGACVGMKGSRVQAVVQELRGEKIDIVPYNDDPARFVCNAIAPAEVSRVIIDAEGHRMELIVPDEKLSLAIGKKGQNVRLASILTGWKLDIHSESKIRELEGQAKAAMASLAGVGEDQAETLFKLGWRSVADLAEAIPEELAAVPGLGGLEAARKITEAARGWLEAERKRQQAAREEAQRRAGLSDEQKLREVQGMTDDALGQLQAAGYGVVEALAREEDLGKLAAATGLGPEVANALRHHARIWLGDVPKGTPVPPVPAEAPAEAEAEAPAEAPAEAGAPADEGWTQ